MKTVSMFPTLLNSVLHEVTLSRICVPLENFVSTIWCSKRFFTIIKAIIGIELLVTLFGITMVRTLDISFSKLHFEYHLYPKRGILQ